MSVKPVWIALTCVMRIRTEPSEKHATLGLAAQALKKSTMLRDAMGSVVIDHYVRCAEWELEDFHSKVTDYEINRGFERA